MRKLGLVIVVAATVAIGAAGYGGVVQAQGQDRYQATLAEVHEVMGFVPTFLTQVAPAALPGAWAELRDLEFSTETALSPKVKALISLAVAAQIPCHYCVWLDTNSAYAAGATEQEVQEAVAMAALTRHWSTILNGMQIDFAQLQAEFAGGE